MTYVFSYKRSLFSLWRNIKVVGHSLEIGPQNTVTGAMVLYLPDGSIYRIHQWHECYMRLGSDWLVAQKKVMSAESGQTIQTVF